MYMHIVVYIYFTCHYTQVSFSLCPPPPPRCALPCTQTLSFLSLPPNLPASQSLLFSIPCSTEMPGTADSAAGPDSHHFSRSLTPSDSKDDSDKGSKGKGSGMTQLIRNKLRFNDESLWKRFSARRLELIDTMALSDRKASEQDSAIRQVAHTLRTEYGYDEDTIPDFEKLVRAGIQSVRRNRKRLPKSKAPSTTPSPAPAPAPPHIYSALPLYPRQKMASIKAFSPIDNPQHKASIKASVGHNLLLRKKPTPNSSLHMKGSRFPRSESVNSDTSNQMSLPRLSSSPNEDDLIPDSSRGRMSISSLVSPEPQSMASSSISPPLKPPQPKHQIIPPTSSLTVPLIITPDISAPLSLRTITKFVSLLDTYSMESSFAGPYSNILSFSSLGASVLETAAYYAVTRHVTKIQSPVKTVHGLLLHQRVLAQVATVLPSLVVQLENDSNQYQQSKQYPVDEDGDIDLQEQSKPSDPQTPSDPNDLQGSIKDTLSSLLAKIALCADDRGFDSVIFMFCEVFEQILAVTSDPLPDIYDPSYSETTGKRNGVSKCNNQMHSERTSTAPEKIFDSSDDEAQMPDKRTVSPPSSEVPPQTPDVAFKHEEITLNKASSSATESDTANNNLPNINTNTNIFNNHDKSKSISPTPPVSIMSHNLFTLTAAAASVSKPPNLSNVSTATSVLNYSDSASDSNSTTATPFSKSHQESDSASASFSSSPTSSHTSNTLTLSGSGQSINGFNATRPRLIPVTLRFFSRLLHFTYNPHTSTPPTISEILENCQSAFQIINTNRVLRIKDVNNHRVIETDAQLEEIYKRASKIDLALVYPTLKNDDNEKDETGE